MAQQTQQQVSRRRDSSNPSPALRPSELACADLTPASQPCRAGRRPEHGAAAEGIGGMETPENVVSEVQDVHVQADFQANFCFLELRG